MDMIWMTTNVVAIFILRFFSLSLSVIHSLNRLNFYGQTNTHQKYNISYLCILYILDTSWGKERERFWFESKGMECQFSDRNFWTLNITNINFFHTFYIFFFELLLERVRDFWRERMKEWKRKMWQNRKGSECLKRRIRKY